MKTDFEVADTGLFSMVLPDAWLMNPSDPTEYGEWTTDLVAQIDMDETERARLVATLRSLFVELKGEGLIMSASYVDQIENEESPLGFELLMATAFATAEHNEDLIGVRTPFAWKAALLASQRDDGIHMTKPPEIVVVAEREFVKATTIDAMAPIEELPAGELFGATYYISLGDGSTVLTIGFRTPCLWMTDEFEALFDAIIATVEFLDGGSDGGSDGGPSVSAESE